MGWALTGALAAATLGVVGAVLYRRRYKQAVEYAAYTMLQLDEATAINYAMHLNIAKHNARKTNLELGVVLPPDEENNN